jgi:hypothetical protein
MRTTRGINPNPTGTAKKWKTGQRIVTTNRRKLTSIPLSEKENDAPKILEADRTATTARKPVL